MYPFAPAASRLARTQLAFDLRRQHHDAHARVVYLWCACVWAFLLGWPTTFVEFAATAAAAFCVVLPQVQWRAWMRLFAQPVCYVFLAYAALMVLSVSWSLDRRQGWHELAGLRWSWAFLLAWPAMEHRRWLIAAFCLGMGAGNLTQLAHALGVVFDAAWLRWPRMPDRNSGWWDPVVGGSLLTAALGVHLSLALDSPARACRRIGRAGAGITLVGIAVTGTRGAWIAAAGLCALACVYAILSRWKHGNPRVRGAARVRPPRPARAGVTLAVVAVLIVSSAYSGPVRRRLEAGVGEVRIAIREKRFDSDTGARLLMGWWAIEAWTESARSVIVGQGAGSYRAWCVANLARRQIPPGSRRLHEHAHNALLHALATLGISGAGLLVVMVGAGVRTSLGVAHRAAEPASPPPEPASASAASRAEPADDHGVPGAAGAERFVSWCPASCPGFALAGLALVSVFDSVQINQQTGAVMFFFVALALGNPPRERRVPGFFEGKEKSGREEPLAGCRSVC